MEEKPGGSHMAKDTRSKKGATEEVPGVKPEIVESVVKKAEEEGLSPETAKDIMREALEEGTEPEKIEEVAQEAIEVEREDQEKSR
jgi:chorismate mutase